MRLIALIALASITFNLNAQSQGLDWAQAEVGIVAGFNHPWLKTTFVTNEHRSPEVLSVSEEQNPGISMGLTVAYPLTGFLKARTALMYSRYDNKLKYLVQSNGAGNITVIEQPSASTVEIPLHFILSPTNYSFDPSLMAGPKYGVNLNKNASDQSLNYRRHHLGFDVGASATFTSQYFDITPEITYTFGWSPLATLGHGSVGGSIDEVRRNALTLSVYLH